VPWLVDGSNVLGADRQNDEAKRALMRMLAGFARAKRTRVTCVFDGPEPPSFGRSLGAATAVLSGARSADELIAERAAHGHGWSVVTNDRGLAAKVQRRQVTVVAPAAFMRELEATAGGEEATGNDWSSWFADPKNRMDF
jgi:hypothetical protein